MLEASRAPGYVDTVLKVARSKPYLESQVDLETEKKRSSVMAKVTQADADTLSELAKLLETTAQKS
jgi:hypothetical protein